MFGLAGITNLCTATYSLVDNFSGPSFFDHFQFFNNSDPSHGFVEYVNSTTAVQRQYVALFDSDAQANYAYLGIDQSPNLSSARPSVRIISHQSWTHGLIVADIHAAPTGCGLWPAMWLVNPGTWPGSTGEIDVFETVHESGFNTMSLHTSSGCEISNASNLFSGNMITDNCDVAAADQAANSGCSIEGMSETINRQVYATAGPEFNQNGGGVYALQWSSSNISVFFFPRGLVPEDIMQGLPSPAGWSQRPLASFSGSDCILDQHIANLSLVINIDACGDWAGQTWQSSGCAAKTGISTCDAYVANATNAFAQAFWLIDNVKIYQTTD